MLVDAVSAEGAEHVLDVGCGTGGTTLAVARRLGPAGHCVGVDISGPLTDTARARAEREGVPASFVRADAQEHTFEPGTFDTVISRFGVMFFDDPVRAFGNLRSAVRDGAGLRVIGGRDPAENPFMTTAQRAAAPLLPSLPVRRPDEPGQFAFADPGQGPPHPGGERVGRYRHPAHRHRLYPPREGAGPLLHPARAPRHGPARGGRGDAGTGRRDGSAPPSIPLCRARRSASPRPAGRSAPGPRPRNFREARPSFRSPGGPRIVRSR
ncbi:class I SAM-dependent methyltransferase [Streptomyces violaceus]|uniref:class I SAM-dependent methyltransferase n=1 Tax=Streptomyces violaceus TaxID=1936 RepID=UPI0031E71960